MEMPYCEKVFTPLASANPSGDSTLYNAYPRRMDAGASFCTLDDVILDESKHLYDTGAIFLCIYT